MRTALTILGLILVIGLVWWLVDRNNGEDLVNGEDNAVVCTMDAKLCPDGSYVGREGPNCEFRACPGEVNGASTDGEGDEPIFDKG